MGRKQREKKLEKIEQELAEKQGIEQRRSARVAPIIKTTKRIVVAVLATTFILYVGAVINSRLPDILDRLLEKGS